MSFNKIPHYYHSEDLFDLESVFNLSRAVKLALARLTRLLTVPFAIEQISAASPDLAPNFYPFFSSLRLLT